MYRYILLTFVFFLAVACEKSPQSRQVTRFHEDGRAKPIVTIVPVIDTSSFDAPWSLSEELTVLLQKKIAQQGLLFLSSPLLSSPLHSNKNPFLTNSLHWVKEEFSPSEFVVFCELIEHDNVPVVQAKKDEKYGINDIQQVSSHLNLSMRIRVVDIRSNACRVILQETLHASQYLSKATPQVNYNVSPWGSEDYLLSPLAIIHNELSKEIVERVTDYVLLAKSQ